MVIPFPLSRPKICFHAWNLFFPRVVAKRYPTVPLPLMANDIGTRSLPATSTESVFEYSVGDGEWKTLDDQTGEVKFGGSKGNLRLRGKSLLGTNYSNISFTDPDVKVSCTGDIRTLVDYEYYRTVETDQATFSYLFNGCTVLTTAPELPAMKLAAYCYTNMFKGCTSLTKAPKLPATGLAEYCYQCMFEGCSKLTEVPSELPATTLATCCYSYMFMNCTSLNASPKLPATSLENNCYRGMFQGCTSLTTAPELKASTLVNNCYSLMFYDCSKLSSVTMLADDVSAESCLLNWLQDAGTQATSRTLILSSQTVYFGIKNNLPANWKAGSENTTVTDKDGNAITP